MFLKVKIYLIKIKNNKIYIQLQKIFYIHYIHNVFLNVKIYLMVKIERFDLVLEIEGYSLI